MQQTFKKYVIFFLLLLEDWFVLNKSNISPPIPVSPINSILPCFLCDLLSVFPVIVQLLLFSYFKMSFLSPVLLACCFLSSLHFNFFTFHYPFAVSLAQLSSFSIPLTVTPLYFWSADFGSFSPFVFGFCSDLCISSTLFFNYHATF